MALDYNLLALYIVAAFATIAIPGPVVLLVAGAGLQGGPMKALRTLCGANCAVLVFILLSALAMKGVFAINAVAFDAVKIAGSCYLAYMGWGMLRQAKKVQHVQHVPNARGEQDEPAGRQSIGGFSRGFILALSNPKYIVFFASFFPQFMGITRNMNISLVVLTALWLVLDFPTLMLMYLLVRRLFKPAVHQAVLRLSGLLFILVAIAGILVTALPLYYSTGAIK